MRKKKTFVQIFMANRLAMVGFTGVVIIALMGLFAPAIAKQPKGYGP